MAGELNPGLFAKLKAYFRTVRVVQRGVPFHHHIGTDPRSGQLTVLKNGPHEQYEVDCPFCGDEDKRLSISSAWLTQPVSYLPMLTHNLICYNEECEGVYSPEFYKQFLSDGIEHLLKREVEIAPEPVKPDLRMPKGSIPLDQLPADHPAVTFLLRKYNGLTPDYLARGYGAVFASEQDPVYRMAYNRIIFPIFEKGEFVAWQGRAISVDMAPKWLFSPGHRRNFYNGDRIESDKIPVICEGITSSIACGPFATAIYNKVIDDRMAREFASRWRSAVVLLDPETFVPDMRTEKRNCKGTVTAPARVYAQELIDQLNKYCQFPVHAFRWPDEVLELARRKVRREEVNVPDPADLGLARMRELLIAQTPSTHRNT